MEGGGPFMDLGKEKIELKEEDGATLLVDLDDTIIFWYFPGYIGQGLQVRSKLTRYTPGRVLTCAAEHFLRQSYRPVGGVSTEERPEKGRQAIKRFRGWGFDDGYDRVDRRERTDD